MFETEIDRAAIPKVTKFSYLKELLEPKVRVTIDGLYERAKTIFKPKNGSDSEIVHACVQNILSMPTIKGTDVVKIHDFYKKLVSSVQSLETLGKRRLLKVIQE